MNQEEMKLLTEQLRRHEGVMKHAYKDHLGYLTIGVGRLCDPQFPNSGLSDDEIDYLLTNDINTCIKELGSSFHWFGLLSSARQRAMINLAFNLGIPRLKGFKNALAAMEREDYVTAANEFMDSKWAGQVGSRAIEVTEMIRNG
jgi:lysozyme